jgi:hypothetical protein
MCCVLFIYSLSLPLGILQPKVSEVPQVCLSPYVFPFPLPYAYVPMPLFSLYL